MLNPFTHFVRFTHASKTRLLVLFTVIMLLILYQHFSITKVEADPLYSCGNLSTGHCYGRVYWQGGTDGSQTEIYTNGLSSGDGFVDDEEWIQSNDAKYWVEGGFINSTEFSGELTFWADSRPGGGFHLHAMYYLSSSDYGKYAYLIMQRDSQGASTWDVTSGGIYAGFSGVQSTNQTFTPGAIDMGTELAGSSGAVAPRNGYIYNEWFSYSNGNTWHYQTNAGQDADPGSIVSHYWVASPTANGSNHGGQYSTCFNNNC